MFILYIEPIWCASHSLTLLLSLSFNCRVARCTLGLELLVCIFYDHNDSIQCEFDDNSWELTHLDCVLMECSIAFPRSIGG
jgi:hypothetical protein